MLEMIPGCISAEEEHKRQETRNILVTLKIKESGSSIPGHRLCVCVCVCVCVIISAIRSIPPRGCYVHRTITFLGRELGLKK